MPFCKWHPKEIKGLAWSGMGPAMGCGSTSDSDTDQTTDQTETTMRHSEYEANADLIIASYHRGVQRRAAQRARRYFWRDYGNLYGSVGAAVSLGLTLAFLFA
jgi:hypothetical protein